MKKSLFFVVTLLLSYFTINAQIVLNPSFENWSTDTSTLDLSIIGYPKDTFTFPDPVDWTSSNYVTGADSLGYKLFVSQSSNAHSGSSAVEVITDTVVAPFVGRTTIPGFVINGNLKLNLNSFMNNFSITRIPGSGNPISGRAEKIGGYLKYTPAPNDSSAVISILKKGDKIIAKAEYFHKTTDVGYVYFEMPYTYYSCDIPDTAVILISSSNPYTLEKLIGGGTTGITPGSKLLADSIFIVPASPLFVVNPIAVSDTVNTPNNKPVNIPVVLNDVDCQSLPLSVTGNTSPAKGAVVLSGSIFTYTANTNYVGKDSFMYTLSNGVKTSTTKVYINVGVNDGIADLSEIGIAVYPNPAKDFIAFENFRTINKVSIINQLGQNVLTAKSNFDYMAISELKNGIYFVKIELNDGKVGIQKLIINK